MCVLKNAAIIPVKWSSSSVESDVLGCYACITVHHRQCEKVVHIPDIVKESGIIVELTDFHQKLESIAKQLTNHKEKIQVNIDKNMNMKKLAKDELKSHRAEINKFFDELEKKLDIQIENIEKEINKILKVASDRLESMQACFNEMKSSIRLKKKGQNCELFIAMKKSKNDIEWFNNAFKKLLDERKLTRYPVLPSEQIQAMMGTITEIGRMTTARLQTKIDVSTTKDKEIPRIRGLTNVYGHNCVVADNSNKSLKVIDTRRKCVTSEISVDSNSLWGLTTVHDDEVAVSVYLPDFKQTIQFFSVSASGDIISKAKQFDATVLCMDVDNFNDKLFLCQRTHILICNTGGQIIKKLKHNSAGFPTIKNLRGIVLNQDGETIYVTDEANNAVISMALNGSVKAICKDKNMKHPWGITVDERGYVYVHSIGTHTVHQLTADLRWAQIIIDNVFGVGVTISGRENQLYIDKNNCVCVYDLSH